MGDDGWTRAELAAVDAADELQIRVRRPDGSLRPPVTIWAVTAEGGVYVRTWHRRDTGWFGRVVVSRRASVEVPGLVRDVVVDDVGAADPAVRAVVDAAFRAAYARYGDAAVARMVSDDAATATLLLRPE